jgi:hypothetical protein
MPLFGVIWLHRHIGEKSHVPVACGCCRRSTHLQAVGRDVGLYRDATRADSDTIYVDGVAAGGRIDDQPPADGSVYRPGEVGTTGYRTS